MNVERKKINPPRIAFELKQKLKQVSDPLLERTQDLFFTSEFPLGSHDRGTSGTDAFQQDRPFFQCICFLIIRRSAGFRYI